MNLIFKKLPIKKAFIISFPNFLDERGQFLKLFNYKNFETNNISFDIKQINISSNFNKGTLRGLHFQYGVGLENKIIYCLKGRIFDVFVDLRKTSKTYKKIYSIELGGLNKGILIPSGCAHGFQTLEKNTTVLYLHSNIYNPSTESGIVYNDKELNIKWPLKPNNISERDLKLQTLIQFENKNYEM